MAAKTLLRFSDIRAVRDDGKRLVLLTRGDDVVVPIAFLREAERSLVRERFENALKATQGAAATVAV